MANLKYSISKLIGKLTYLVLKVMPTGGKAYPGYLYLKNMGVENLNMLIKRSNQGWINSYYRYKW